MNICNVIKSYWCPFFIPYTNIHMYPINNLVYWNSFMQKSAILKMAYMGNRWKDIEKEREDIVWLWGHRRSDIEWENDKGNVWCLSKSVSVSFHASCVLQYQTIKIPPSYPTHVSCSQLLSHLMWSFTYLFNRRVF